MRWSVLMIGTDSAYQDVYTHAHPEQLITALLRNQEATWDEPHDVSRINVVSGDRCLCIMHLAWYPGVVNERAQRVIAELVGVNIVPVGLTGITRIEPSQVALAMEILTEGAQPRRD